MKYENNWLCPNCNSRPPAQMTAERDGKHYCIYCDEHLDFEKIEEWQKTFDKNRSQRNKNNLEAYEKAKCES